MGVTVTVIRHADGGTDTYGDRVDGAATEHTIGGVGIAPRHEMEETAAGRQGRPIGWTLFAPYGADILATDRVRLPDGTECEVDGEPGRWEHIRTNRRWGLEVPIKRYEG